MADQAGDPTHKQSPKHSQKIIGNAKADNNKKKLKKLNTVSNVLLSSVQRAEDHQSDAAFRSLWTVGEGWVSNMDGQDSDSDTENGPNNAEPATDRNDERLKMNKYTLRFASFETEMVFRSSRVAAVLNPTCIVFLVTAAPGAMGAFFSLNALMPTHLWIATLLRVILPWGSLVILFLLWWRGTDKKAWSNRDKWVVRAFDTVVWLQIIGDVYCNGFAAGVCRSALLWLLSILRWVSQEEEEEKAKEKEKEVF